MSNVSLIEFWQYYRGKTIEFLQHLTDEQLAYRPLEGLKALGEELRHVGDVRDIYLRALTAGVGPDWADKRMEREMETSIDKLRAYYQELDRRFDEFCAAGVPWEKVVQWESMGDPDVEATINYMMHFECLHQGFWMAYIAGLGLDFDISG